MKGKSKSKKKPTSGETRVRLTLKDKRDVIAMRKMGLSREKIEAKMGKLSDTLWYSIWRKRDELIMKRCDENAETGVVEVYNDD